MPVDKRQVNRPLKVFREVLGIPASRALAPVQAGIRPAAPSIHVAAVVI
jgi:hypothetical protein